MRSLTHVRPLNVSHHFFRAQTLSPYLIHNTDVPTENHESDPQHCHNQAILKNKRDQSNIFLEIKAELNIKYFDSNDLYDWVGNGFEIRYPL